MNLFLRKYLCSFIKTRTSESQYVLIMTRTAVSGTRIAEVTVNR